MPTRHGAQERAGMGRRGSLGVGNLTTTASSKSARADRSRGLVGSELRSGNVRKARRQGAKRAKPSFSQLPPTKGPCSVSMQVQQTHLLVKAPWQTHTKNGKPTRQRQSKECKVCRAGLGPVAALHGGTKTRKQVSTVCLGYKPERKKCAKGDNGEVQTTHVHMCEGCYLQHLPHVGFERVWTPENTGNSAVAPATFTRGEPQTEDMGATGGIKTLTPKPYTPWGTQI